MFKGEKWFLYGPLEVPTEPRNVAAVNHHAWLCDVLYHVNTKKVLSGGVPPRLKKICQTTEEGIYSRARLEQSGLLYEFVPRETLGLTNCTSGLAAAYHMMRLGAHVSVRGMNLYGGGIDTIGMHDLQREAKCWLRLNLSERIELPQELLDSCYRLLRR